MKTFTKHILLLALMLFGAAGAAWADYVPQKYTGPVDIATLQVGDTLAQGFELTGNQNAFFYFKENRAKENGTLLTLGTGFMRYLIDGYGRKGTVQVDPDVYTPVLEDQATDGNAWVVIGVQTSPQYIVTVAGAWVAPDPNVPELDELTGNWNFLMPGANKVVKVEYYDTVLVGANVAVQCSTSCFNIAYGYRNMGGDSILYFENSPILILTATPPAGKAFDGWSDGNTDNPRVVELAGDTAFLPIFYTPRTLVLNQTDGGSLALNGYSPAQPNYEPFVTNQGTYAYRNDPITYSSEDFAVYCTHRGDEYGAKITGSSSFYIAISSSAGNIDSIVMRVGYYSYNASHVYAKFGTCTVRGSGEQNTYISVTGINAASDTIRSNNDNVQIDRVVVYRGGTPEILPADVIAANATFDTFQVKSGVELTVVATPDSAHYLKNFVGGADTNSNTAVNNTFTVTADTTVTANFAAKPVLTLTANDTTWGKVIVTNGAAIADEVQIGDETGTTYYFPIDQYFNYSCTEQIYTADEIGTAGTINSISFYYNYGTPYTANNVTMYLKHVSRSEFVYTSDCEPLSVNDIVWTGSIAPTGAGWYTFTLDTPFEYNGTDNLMVAFYDGTSGYAGNSYTWRQTESPNSAYMALRYYSDNNNPDPYNLSGYTGGEVLYNYRNNIKLDITPAATAIVALSDTTYRVDYGTEVTLIADATELHHVAGWEDQNGDSLQVATYSAYFITEPEMLFPDSSAVTFTMTTDTVARAMFGLNYRKLYFSHNAGGMMEFVVAQDSMLVAATQEVVESGAIKVEADSADAEGMFLREGESSIMITAKGATITQVDFHVTNGTNLVNTIT